MTDIWSFLLQTLTASGVAVLLLIVKAMFRDKLPPKWQFGIWGVLALVLILPAGMGGRYVLVNWPLLVEALKSALAGEYSITRVFLPFPILTDSPRTVWDWVFAGYVVGVIVHLLKYAASYLRLRLVLRRGGEVSDHRMGQILRLAGELNVPICKIVEVPGLPSAFVCGVFSPVLALPADSEPDEKILLHELMHLKYRDTVWSILCCVLRSIHWCNPLLVHCSGQVLNDLESRCDQRVLERLSGEERRDYGRILLSMANDRFAKTPGSTCVNNGGKNIRRRIEAIARFKLYPAGMELVSICAAIILALPMVIGVQATEVSQPSQKASVNLALASARSTYCTTPAGAFDTYGKAILEQNGIYRVMCAPEEMQAALAETVTERYEAGQFPYWDTGLLSWPDTQQGYYIYNLQKVDGGYEGLLVIRLNYPPDGQPGEEGMMYLATQKLRVEEENGRWVAIALEEFQGVETVEESLKYGCLGLPDLRYAGTAGDFLTEVKYQTVRIVDSSVTTDSGWFYSATSYSTVPIPDAEFTWEYEHHEASVTHFGSEEDRAYVTEIGLAYDPVLLDEDRPELFVPGQSSGNTSGNHWSARSTEPGWGPTFTLGGGGSGSYGADLNSLCFPAYYAAELYINGQLEGQMELVLQEGESQ